MAEGQQMLLLDTELRRDLANRLHFCLAGNLDITPDLLRHGSSSKAFICLAISGSIDGRPQDPEGFALP